MNRSLRPARGCVAAFLLVVAAASAQAQIRIGVTVSSTGPAAALGIPEKNAVELLPREIAGKKVDYVVLDDASDTTMTVTNVRKLATEEKVDAIIGSTTTPNSLAMLPVLGELKVPAITLASSSRIVEPMDANRAWMFKTPQSDTMMATAIAENMSNAGVKTMAFIGFNNALGEAFYTEVEKYAELKGIKVVASERFAPTDTSVTGQILKIVAAHPGRGGDRRVRIAGRDAGPRAARARLSGPHLSQPRRREPRVPARSAASTATARSCRPGR